MSEPRTQPISIHIQHVGEQPFEVAVMAELIGPFAIHLPHDWWHDFNSLPADDYTLTHRGTGYAVRKRLTIEQARALASSLLEPPLTEAWWRGLTTPKDVKADANSEQRAIVKARILAIGDPPSPPPLTGDVCAVQEQE